MSESLDDGRVYGAEGGESLFPISQENASQEGSYSCELCNEDGKILKAEGFCPDCNAFMCKSCINTHDKIPATRNHIIKGGTRMPKTQTEKPVKYPNCNIHVGTDSDHFCPDHNSFVCSECMKTTHALCGTTSISNLCDHVGATDVKQLKDALINIQETLKASSSTIKCSIDESEASRILMKKELTDIRDKIIAQTQERYSDLITKIDEGSNSNTSLLSDNLSLVTDIHHWIDKTVSGISKDADKACEENTFIRLHECAASARRCKRELENINIQLQKPQTTFIANKAALAFLSNSCQLGEVKENLTKLQLFSSLPEVDFPQRFGPETKDTTLKKRDILRITTKTSQSLKISNTNCVVSGLDKTDDGTIILAEGKNKKVIAVSTENKILSCLSFPNSPTTVAVINQLIAAVCTDDGFLHMLNISRQRGLSLQRSVLLGHAAVAFARCGCNFIVVGWGTPACVKMLDLSGQELWFTSVDTRERTAFEYPFAVTYNITNGKTNIIVSDWGKNRLTMLNATNGKVTRIEHVGQTKPHGLTSDDDGNIYVCNLQTKEVYCDLVGRFKAVQNAFVV